MYSYNSRLLPIIPTSINLLTLGTDRPYLPTVCRLWPMLLDIYKIGTYSLYLNVYLCLKTRVTKRKTRERLDQFSN